MYVELVCDNDVLLFVEVVKMMLDFYVGWVSLVWVFFGIIRFDMMVYVLGYFLLFFGGGISNMYFDYDEDECIGVLLFLLGK